MAAAIICKSCSERPRARWPARSLRLRNDQPPARQCPRALADRCATATVQFCTHAAATLLFFARRAGVRGSASQRNTPSRLPAIETLAEREMSNGVRVSLVLLACWYFAPRAAGLPAQAPPIAPRTQSQADACRRPANAIVAENCKPGNPSTEWDVNGSGDPRIQGYATDISANVGETIAFKIKSDSKAYRIDLYRLGYYGGMGARHVASTKPSVPLPQRQPECLSDAQTRLYDCGNWAVSASWRVPPDAVSGIYLARLVREDVEPLNWRADNSGAGQATPKPAAGPHAYGASGLGKLANALKEPRASLIYF